MHLTWPCSAVLCEKVSNISSPKIQAFSSEQDGAGYCKWKELPTITNCSTLTNVATSPFVSSEGLSRKVVPVTRQMHQLAMSPGTPISFWRAAGPIVFSCGERLGTHESRITRFSSFPGGGGAQVTASLVLTVHAHIISRMAEACCRLIHAEQFSSSSLGNLIWIIFFLFNVLKQDTNRKPVK